MTSQPTDASVASDVTRSPDSRPNSTDGSPDGVGAWVISGPTAVGKGTVVAALRARCPELFVSISVTTRAPRPGEIDGVHYYFIDDAAFDELVANDGLLEWAIVHGRHRYGTPRRPVVEALTAGHPTILEIDLQGARQVRRTMPEAVQVFIKPPSWDELVRRLRGRGTEDEEQMARRLATARAELAAEGEFDHVVCNVTVEQTVSELVTLIGL